MATLNAFQIELVERELCYCCGGQGDVFARLDGVGTLVECSVCHGEKTVEVSHGFLTRVGLENRNENAI